LVVTGALPAGYVAWLALGRKRGTSIIITAQSRGFVDRPG
jgi:hypothetical protein